MSITDERFHLFQQIPRVGTAGSWTMYMFISVRNCQTDFQSGCYMFYTIRICKFQLLCILANIWYCQLFQWIWNVNYCVFHLHFLMTNDANLAYCYVFTGNLCIIFCEVTRSFANFYCVVFSIIDFSSSSYIEIYGQIYVCKTNIFLLGGLPFKIFLTVSLTSRNTFLF